MLLEGDAIGGAGPEVIATESTLFPDSLDLMGWDIVDTGMRVIFGTGIPRVVTAQYRGLATEFVGARGFRIEYSMVRKLDEVRLRGVAFGAVRNGELFLINYSAPRLAFYPKHAAGVEALARSAKVKG